MIRVSLIALALLSPFFFPWPVTLVLGFVAATFLPPVALLVGALSDALYYIPGASVVPLATLVGLCGMGLATVVHQFVKTRIIH